MNQLSSPEWVAAKMREMAEDDSPAVQHETADELLCDVLRELGYGDAVDVFEGMKRWYV